MPIPQMPYSYGGQSYWPSSQVTAPYSYGGTSYVPQNYAPVQSTGSVLGAGTGPAPQPQPQPVPTPNPSPDQQQVSSLQDQQRGEISGGYDSYFSQLDQMLNEGLPAQQSAQMNIANSQYDQGVSDITGQKTMSLGDLGLESQKTQANQVKNLGNLGESLRNQFLTGSIMLGSKGAGDSSAANMYAYGLSKLGNKSRGDIMTNTANIQSEIANRVFKVKTIFDTETNRLKAELGQKTSGIQQWFAEAQNQIAQMKAQGSLNKAQDLASITQNALNYALQQLQNINTKAQNDQTALQQWALNNATTVEGIKSNMSQLSQYAPTLPAFSGLQGAPQWGANNNLTYTPTGYGGPTEEQKKSLVGYL